MATNSALLAAVLADPENDTPRLVYADWLEDNGEAERAACIRDAIRTGEESRFVLDAGTWFRIPGNVVPTEHNRSITAAWKRGFPWKLWGTLAALLEHGPAIVLEHPVTAVEVTDANPEQSKNGLWPGWAINMPKRFDEPHGLRLTYGYQTRKAALDDLNNETLAELRRRAATIPSGGPTPSGRSRPSVVSGSSRGHHPASAGPH